jgi:hypothetical protein
MQPVLFDSSIYISLFAGGASRRRAKLRGLRICPGWQALHEDEPRVSAYGAAPAPGLVNTNKVRPLIS